MNDGMNGDFSVTKKGVYHPNFFSFRDALEVSWIGDLCGQRVSGSESDGGGLVMVGGFAPKSQVVGCRSTNPRVQGGWILWILGSNPKRKWLVFSFFFEVELNISGQPLTWFSRKKLGKGLEDENFSKKETNSHIRTKPGRRVEIHLKTVSLGKLVGWYFVKSLICLPFTRHHFGYPGKRYNEYIELAKFLI